LPSRDMRFSHCLADAPHEEHPLPVGFAYTSSHLRNVPTVTSFTSDPASASDEPPPKEEDKGVLCNWYDLQLGNNIGHWKGDRPAIKYQYDHDLKGLELRYWWPGKAGRGECNNVNDTNRGCWFRGRMLNDPSCDEKMHCLHVAGHDGEPAHTYTCPTWLRNHEGLPCKLPPEWQACPRKFKLMRVDSGVPQDFKDALSEPCGPMGEEHCLGNTEFETDIGMYFDVRQNQWYRCTPWMKCEKFDIKEISDKTGTKCGQHNCGEDEICFDHRITSKQSTFHCVPENKVFLISAGDDMAMDEMPLSLALLPQSLHRASRRKSRCSRKRDSTCLGCFL